MKSREFLESIANQIVADFNLNDAISCGSAPDEQDTENSFSVGVDLNLETFLEKIQAAIDKHDLNRDDSVTVVALCLHKALEMPMDEARATASSAIQDD